MKKATSFMLAAILLIALLTGCSDDAKPKDKDEKKQTATLGADIADEDAYLNALGSEPTSLDFVKTSQASDRSVQYNILEPLIRIEDGAPAPAGAEAWEISDDNLRYTFHLRENHWSDGVKVKAQDYAYLIQRAADPANAFAYAADYYPIRNFERIFNGEADADELGVET
ncbi:MAG: ABC transporter substrate-binding protein, partial [Clostridiales Family XIII bacterium]|nr:ABC transporter substrate-binding protein [Clostridiales Family XIII bacterium]